MAYNHLKPLNVDPDRDQPRFGVCDIESYKWTQFRVCGFGWKTYTDDGLPAKKHYYTFFTMAEFCDFVFEEDFPYDNIFAHFGGRFDFSFALKEYFTSHERYFITTMIPRGSGLLCFEVSTFKKHDIIPAWAKEKDVLGKDPQGKHLIRDKTVTFRDSSAMLPFGLASLTENFGVEHKKKEIDYDTFETVTPEMLEYLEYDIWGLYEVLETYFNWPMIRGAGPAFTVASQALKVFRTFLKKQILCLPNHADLFVRESYIGGRTEIFKPFFQQAKDDGILRSYDVNSLYPAVMRDFDYPGGFHFDTEFYLENKIGFYDVEVFVPEMYVPPLGVRYDGMEERLIFPTGIFRGKWSTVELNYAVSLGCKILKVYKGKIFHNAGPIFKNYVEHLYQMRKDSEKNSVTNVLCKLLMNSSYGRFGLNLHREQLEFDRLQPGVRPYLEIPLGNEVIRLVKKQVYLETSFSNVAIAAWVTSQARVWMHELIQESPEDMYYMDTDSLKTTHIYPRNDDDLGKLKLEYKSKRACFVLPKTYMEDATVPIFKTFNEKGKIDKDLKSSKKIVMKGFDRRKIANFTIDDFTSALEGDMRRLRSINPEKFATLKTAVKKGKFLDLIAESPRQIRTRYNKRRVFKKAYAQVYDTEALHIKDGEITNLDKDILKKWKRPKIDDSESNFDKTMQLLGATFETNNGD